MNGFAEVGFMLERDTADERDLHREEEVYGATTFYLANSDDVNEYLERQRIL